MTSYLLNGLTLTLEEEEHMLLEKAAYALQTDQDDIKNWQVIRKAIDARRNRPPRFVYILKIDLSSSLKKPLALTSGMQLTETRGERDIPPLSNVPAPKQPVVVIGSGPAGLFAAYVLASRGLPAWIYERGEPVEKRVKDVEKFWAEGVLNSQSNVCFGEGGAGTFSDGKLTSRSGNPYSSWVKRILVEAGAPPEILFEAKPHVGTDKLRQIIVNLRKKLMDMGCQIHFTSQVTDFLIQQGSMSAVVINAKETIKTRHVILGIGQNADDTYVRLYERGVPMEAKPFAMGVRIEHPQALIQSIQYGKWHNHSSLPPADYFLKSSLVDLNRSVYTFCMCPGGSVIGCAAFDGLLITNGMSHFRRSGEFANSAVVVNVRTEDFTTGPSPLDGLTFRQEWERKAFIAGGGKYRAPAQKTTDFLKGKRTRETGKTSFLPGVTSAALGEILPDFVTNALKRGLTEFNRKMYGFVTEESHLIAVETRTSSPVRICRGGDGQSSAIRGLYPCGEGSGYAGGIISSALDGIKAAQNLIDSLD